VRLLKCVYSGSALFQAEPDAARRAKYRTECWLERCVFAGEVCGADAHPAFVPLPVSGGDACGGALLSVSGLEQAELCWTRRLARARGVPVAPAFSRRSTHLLCPSGAGAKFDKAREWGVPVVGTAWLAEVARTGMIPPPGHFLVGSGGVALPVPEPEVETAPELEDVADAQVFPEPEPEPEPSMHFGVHHGSKGKGKAAPEAGISDITNGGELLPVCMRAPC
jgi:DNA replication regulator DPB11